MTKPINLRTARKQRERLKNRLKGTENAARSGQSQDERALAEARARKLRDHLDSHKRED